MYLAALPCYMMAQEAGTPAKPDSPKVQADIQKAKKDAGTMWANEEHFLCEAPHGNSPNDPVLEPTKLFDNLWALGRTGTTVYALTTTAGIILIDSGFPGEAESIIVEQMKKVNLDPAQIKMVLLGHGHPDHFGGAAYFQDRYHAHIYLSEADWNFMNKPLPPPPPTAPKGPTGPPAILPEHDMVVIEGQPIVLGDVKVTPVAIPGHTPGSLAYIFPVRDNGTTHVAAIWAGTILAPRIISDEGLAQYIKSIAHFEEETKKANVDVEIQNHPLFDDMDEKLAKLKGRTPGQTNPFIVGKANYQRFLEVMQDCTQANLDRRSQ
jgi:metallo-beta-lactamase class B